MKAPLRAKKPLQATSLLRANEPPHAKEPPGSCDPGGSRRARSAYWYDFTISSRLGTFAYASAAFSLVTITGSSRYDGTTLEPLS